ncbi:hypothetical protein E2C01_047255 [Portunus trituberculatus]|uniref:Uncharacterized protein n=1 Tax=Portunus trituberculatus TaxID=210409 RepID=A0A5B7G787_PORTR|nr:hypothetical protein [Portunus trituberculatus]
MGWVGVAWAGRMVVVVMVWKVGAGVGREGAPQDLQHSRCPRPNFPLEEAWRGLRARLGLLRRLPLEEAVQVGVAMQVWAEVGVRHMPCQRRALVALTLATFTPSGWKICRV